MNTKEYLDQYLKENISESETLSRMRNVISEFAARAPKILVTKCIDGRVHGSKQKGFPATTIRFGRTDGNIVSTDKNNYWFWNRIDNVVNNALCNTPEMPAIFIAYMHRSDLGLGCAAHNNNESLAFNAINSQTTAIRKVFSPEKLYVLEGITNTDTMAETLIFENSIRISTEEIIKDFHLNELQEVFYKGFLKYPIKDPATSRFVDFKTPEELMQGNLPLFHADFQTSLAMKSFLLLEISKIVYEKDYSSQKLIQPDILNALVSSLSKIKSMPTSLFAPFLYQCFWNLGYSLYQTKRLLSMPEEEKQKHLDHGEELICYGDGFELLPRNKTILVKTGRGDDSNALQVAKRVLEKNRTKKSQNFDPIIHLNIEISGELINWEDFNETISSRMDTMMRHVDEVFDTNASVLTTYSYRDQKRFYPVKTRRDSRNIYPINLLEAINSSILFSNMALKSREALYATGSLI
ncbi:MAG: hypothetical protein KBF93_17730 [Leptospiraceae bacterium]|nr:hypothetical protein [Leptospiraceae bacterium]